MQTNIIESLLNTHEGKQAEAILRKCVHCGFCTATCPTYQTLGDELDSPRGRIYLIKEMLEGSAVTGKTLSHLDKCLTCRNCETTCPSGVEYGRLIDIGRHIAEQKIRRGLFSRITNKCLNFFFSKPELFAILFGLGKAVRVFLPYNFRKKLHVAKDSSHWSSHRSKRKIILLTGCVQPSLGPEIDRHFSHLLAHCDIETYPIAGCCGSVTHHLNQHDAAVKTISANVNKWYDMLQTDYEAICMTASGCGLAIREYPNLFEPGTGMYEKARYVADNFRDPVELLNAAEVVKHCGDPKLKYAFHPPCTLQHGLKLEEKVTSMLNQFGISLEPFAEKHLCCGSAGTYSITQPELSNKILHRKLSNIESTNADVILTANIGCMNHLQGKSSLPVKHWISEVYSLLKL